MKWKILESNENILEKIILVSHYHSNIVPLPQKKNLIGIHTNLSGTFGSGGRLVQQLSSITGKCNFKVGLHFPLFGKVEN
jgi:hypothetical protein